jgi:beta-lactamase class D
MRLLILHVLFFITFVSCAQEKKNNTLAYTLSNYLVHNCQKHFSNCGVTGAVAIFSRNNQQWVLSDTAAVKNSYLPASTFKILNLLIALETNTIKDEHEIVPWIGKTDTIKYGFRPEIYHDMTVKEAFEVSAGWVFIELAKKIGRNNYKKYLSACKYGNLNLSQTETDFWNFGSFAISPLNQVEFIRDLYEEKLPFTKRNIKIVKKIMLTEASGDYTISAKTGWTRENNINTGWWVGYLEANNDIYFFATQLLQDRKNKRDDFGSCRKEITKKIFTELGYIRNSTNQNHIDSSLFTSIDHVPIVVKDLEKVKNILKNELFFTIKEGKAHAGIKNCFIKFQDGTYLEFISPTDSLQPIGRHYTNFLHTKQGATSLAISTTNARMVKQMLTEQNTQCTDDSNKVWKTIEVQAAGMFFY